ncbi:LYP1 [Candida margitis]|uniref:LYP1 n=1 Tax=Candida margitis TaxID=1775924 RepID=UPI0022273C2B|nr:LYP1 [Candida margitis]KAI5965415.1 LYP1 [Candida margitis]
MTSKTGIILLIWILLTAANLFPVNYYGEIEFIVTIIKVAFMISWIGLSICLVSLQIGLINWQNRELLWGINTIQVVTNPILNKVINILSSSIVSSCFTFQSIESVGICSGEIEDIGRNLPKAIKYIVMRIVLFYLGSLVLLTLMIPSNDSRLIDNNGNGDSGSAMTSPFVIALINCGVGGTSILINIVNFVILTSMISAANSNIYFGSRCLLSMVEEGYFWPQFAKTTRNGGVPVYAILLTSAIGLIISLLSNWKSMDIFLTLLINLSATTGLLMWLFISVSYLRFRATLEYNGLPYNQLSYTSSSSLLFCLPMRQASWFSIVSIVVIILSNGVTNVWQFNWDSFASCYLTSIVVIIGVVCFSYKWNEPVLKPVAEIDIFTDHSPNAFK